LKEKLPDASEIELGFCSKGKGSSTSRGTTKTMVYGIINSELIKCRKNGKIINCAPEFKDFSITGMKSKRTLSLAGWGDVSTAYHSTGIENIKVYMPIGKYPILFVYYVLFLFFYIPFFGNFILKMVDLFVDGPDAESVKDVRTNFIGIARNKKGESVEIQFSIPSGYPHTADTALRCVDKILSGKLDDSKCGFLTPSLAFGSKFIDECDGYERLN
jgi:short subunit dehydrogenase-like uncharacterized protein